MLTPTHALTPWHARGLAPAGCRSRAEAAALLHVELPKPGPRSFFELAARFPRRGVRMQFRRTNFAPDSHWRVTRVKLKVAPEKFSAASPHGKAWGVLTWRGESDGKERPIRGLYKKLWRHK